MRNLLAAGLVSAVVAVTISTSAPVQVDLGLPKVINVNSPHEAAIRAAIQTAVMTIGPDIIMLPDAIKVGGIKLTSPLPIISGISYKGVPPTYTHSGNVPDNDVTFTGGTWFVGTGAFPCFQAQTSGYSPLDVDKSAPDSNFTTTAIKEANLENVGIQNFSRGISIGAKSQCGLLYSTIRNVVVNGCQDWGVHMVNFQHCEVSRIWTFGNSRGQRYAADVPYATLQPGNSTMSQLFDTPTASISANRTRLHRGLVFEATDGSNLNEIMGYRLQANFFWHRLTTYTAVGGGNGQFTLTGGKGAELQVGMPIKFTSNGGNGNVTAGWTYFVKTISGDTIAVSASRNSSAIQGSFGSSTSFTTYGFGNFEIIGGIGGWVSSSNFTNLDLEGVAQSAFSAENMLGCTISINELRAIREEHIVLRTSQPNYFFVANTYGSDIDGASVNCMFFGSRDMVHTKQNTGVWLGVDDSTNRSTFSIGSADPAIKSGDLSLKRPSGGQFIYPLSGMGQRINGDVGAGTGWGFNAGQAGFIRCTTTGFTPITWNLPDINSDVVGLIFEITNFRSGGGNPTLNITSSGTQFINGIPGQNTVSLAGPVGSTIASARFIACDNGSGFGFYWRVTLEQGASIPFMTNFVTLQTVSPGTPDIGHFNVTGNAVAARFGAGVSPNFARVEVNETGFLQGVRATTSSGIAVYGKCDATAGPGIGGYFASESSNGNALVAESNSTSGSSVAGLFTSDSPNSVSVWGSTKATTGTPIGVLGDTKSPTGIGLVASNTALASRVDLAGPVGSIFSKGTLPKHEYTPGSSAEMVPTAYGTVEPNGQIRYIGSNNWTAFKLGVGIIQIAVTGTTMLPGQYVVFATAVEGGSGRVATIDDLASRPVVNFRDISNGSPTDTAFQFIIFRTSGNQQYPPMPEDLQNPPELREYHSREAWQRADPLSYESYRARSIAWQRAQAEVARTTLPEGRHIKP